MINCINIMGRLTDTPELKVTNSGTNVTTFTVAVERQYSKGEKQTDFINVVAWRGTAEFISKWFSKGQMIAVQGSLQTRKYQDKDGHNRTAFEVVAEQVSFCGDKKADHSNTEQPAQPPAEQPVQTSLDINEWDNEESDLPF
jgi:single-strand DNA-binding protein